MAVATLNQLEYIKILSNYYETKIADNTDIQNFLSLINKKSIEELYIDEASQLIQILLKRNVKYTFPCGKDNIIVNKQDYNCYNLFGDVEACLHNCEINVNDCPIYNPYTKTEYVHLVRKINCQDEDCTVIKKYGRKKYDCDRIRAVCGSCIGKYSFKLEEITCINCLNIMSPYSEEAKYIITKIEFENRKDYKQIRHGNKIDEYIKSDKDGTKQTDLYSY